MSSPCVAQTLLRYKGDANSTHTLKEHGVYLPLSSFLRPATWVFLLRSGRTLTGCGRSPSFMLRSPITQKHPPAGQNGRSPGAPPSLETPSIRPASRDPNPYVAAVWKMQVYTMPTPGPDLKWNTDHFVDIHAIWRFYFYPAVHACFSEIKMTVTDRDPDDDFLLDIPFIRRIPDRLCISIRGQPQKKAKHRHSEQSFHHPPPHS